MSDTTAEHQPIVDEESRALKCSAGDYHCTFGKGFEDIQTIHDYAATDWGRVHQDQFREDRVKNLPYVDIEVHSTCTACKEEYGSYDLILDLDEERITCEGCGASWNVDGRDGKPGDPE